MISTLLTLLTLGSGALGFVGTITKLLGKFAPGVAASVLSNPITAAIGKVAEGFVDLVVWGAKAVLGWLFTRIGNALDHIFSNGFAGVVFLASMVLAYEVGGWGRPSPQAAPVSPPVTRSAPPAASVPSPARKEPSVSLNPLDWLGL